MQHELIELGNKVKALRNAQKISQEELAWRAELDVSFISLVERGAGNASYLTLIKIASGLKVELKQLIE
jgi:transcriptional regulator with XRE-family HTH domain